MKFANILAAVGRTPLVGISSKLNTGKASVWAKVEAFNPGGSAKDRIAIAMIEAAEAQGLLKPGGTIIEPTSGNTGVGLAMASAVKGYHLMLVMPDTMSVERQRLARAYGAEVVLTPGAQGMRGSIEKANELKASIPGAYIPQQFENAANAMAHERTTGPEIWSDLEGQVDALVAGVGTGGSVTGIGRYLRRMNPAVKVYAVEPAESPMISKGVAGPHMIQGIGANFVPKVLDRDLLTDVICVRSEDALATARTLGAKEGILCGISSGAAMWAALMLSQRDDFAGRNIVALLPDTGERYLSTKLFAEQ